MYYGAHSSMIKDKAFFRKYISEKLRVGNAPISPLEDAKHLQLIWISLLAAIPQVGINPIIFYDFSWI